MPTTALTPAIRQEIERLGSADIMVGIPSYRNAATIGYVVRAAQAGLVQYFPDLRPVLVNADAGSPDDTQRVVVDTEPPDYVEQILLVRPTNRLARVSLTYPELDGVGGKGAALRTIFEMAAALKVEALVVVDSDLRSILPEWIELLAGPILKGGYDFVSPLYARYKYDGTITNTVTYPLTRALYGHRIRQPIGGDFGVSGDLVRHYLEQDTWTPEVSRFGIDIWMTTTALTGGFAVCQTRLGAKIHDPKDPGSDLGPMFRQVVGTLLSLAKGNADRWMGITGSHDVPAYGFERFVEPVPLEVNTLRLLSQFHTGSLTLADTWGQMLRPSNLRSVMLLAEEAGTLAENAQAKLGLGSESSEGSLTPLPSTDVLSDAVAGFHFPDDLWARVVYDLVVAASFGDLPPERLVAALVPIYFGRVGSFVIENRRLSGEQAEDRVERQAREFELLKPYLVKHWTEAAAGPKAHKGHHKHAAEPKDAAEAKDAAGPNDGHAAGVDGPAEPLHVEPAAGPSAGPNGDAAPEPLPEPTPLPGTAGGTGAQADEPLPGDAATDGITTEPDRWGETEAGGTDQLADEDATGGNVDPADSGGLAPAGFGPDMPEAGS